MFNLFKLRYFNGNKRNGSPNPTYAAWQESGRLLKSVLMEDKRHFELVLELPTNTYTWMQHKR